MENLDRVEELEVLQREVSLLIQGYGFFMSIQQEIDLRNRIKETYIKKLEKLLPTQLKEV